MILQMKEESLHFVLDNEYKDMTTHAGPLLFTEFPFENASTIAIAPSFQKTHFNLKTQVQPHLRFNEH
jgi:hypothetical protein